MRNIALVLVFLEWTSRCEASARRTIAAAAAEGAPAAGRMGGQGLRDPVTHFGPDLVPGHLENRERWLAIDHAVTGVSEGVDEQCDASGTARVELLGLTHLSMH